MFEYIVEYEKTNIYISHLDLMRIWIRAFMRVKAPLYYSQGFNPHPKLVFAAPLSIGIYGLRESFSVVFNEPAPSVFSKLTLPEGIKILNVVLGKNDFNNIYGSRYEFLPENMPTPELCQRFMDNDQINVLKKTKSGIKEVDIKEDILDLDVNQGMFAKLASGNQKNLNPRLFLDAFSKFTGHDFGFCVVKRINIERKI